MINFTELQINQRIKSVTIIIHLNHYRARKRLNRKTVSYGSYATRPNSDH